MGSGDDRSPVRRELPDRPFRSPPPGHIVGEAVTGVHDATRTGTESPVPDRRRAPSVVTVTT
ncbi:hypothetical protein GCM10007147_44340 [Nocardiopsis kunsanensis]|uniref:Uncharacterized protein n=1 Tax=Nocardiopsis kunsanensis TaxID=141693 RepID=A0A918XKV1_9ACTN|nr:hypothetical protein GCM10007147_44340 [Nocardiopsis kunsanensis]